MSHYHISELARNSGLSRSTLLHYDRIGLLAASGRTPAGYRVYNEKDRRRLERICEFRMAGLSLTDIRKTLDARGTLNAQMLEARLHAASKEIGTLHAQQRLLVGMLQRLNGKGAPTFVDRDMWVSMLRAAGVSQESMNRWHREFECRAPKEHHAFLSSLGLTENEIACIRAASSGATPRTGKAK